MFEPYIINQIDFNNDNLEIHDYLHLGTIFADASYFQSTFCSWMDELEDINESIWKYLLLENTEGYALNDDIYILSSLCPSVITDKYYPIVVNITPNHAFGDGKHPTTILCMKYLVNYLNTLSSEKIRDLALLDAGTGTGILSIVAVKLGIKEIDAIDLNPYAILSSRENCINNQCGWINIMHRDIAQFNPVHQYNIVVANIISEIIMKNIEKIIALTLPHGHIILSGINAHYNDEVQACLKNYREKIELLDYTHLDGWYGYMLRKI